MPTVVGQDKEVAKSITCKNCGAILEYYLYELKDIKHSFDYLGDYSVDKGIICPKCDRNVFTK